MYLSPAVRTIRDDPTDDVEAALVVRFEDDAAAEGAREVIADYGTVDRKTRFGNLHATVSESAVAELLAALPDSVSAVETRTTVADDPGHEG